MQETNTKTPSLITDLTVTTDGFDQNVSLVLEGPSLSTSSPLPPTGIWSSQHCLIH